MRQNIFLQFQRARAAFQEAKYQVRIEMVKGKAVIEGLGPIYFEDGSLLLQVQDHQHHQNVRNHRKKGGQNVFLGAHHEIHP